MSRKETEIMNKELRERFDEAINIFSPDRLFLSLKRDENGTVYYDRMVETLKHKRNCRYIHTY